MQFLIVALFAVEVEQPVTVRKIITAGKFYEAVFYSHLLDSSACEMECFSTVELHNDATKDTARLRLAG